MANKQGQNEQADGRADTAQRVDLPMGMYRDLVTNTDTLGGSVELPPRSWRVLAPR